MPTAAFHITIATGAADATSRYHPAMNRRAFLEQGGAALAALAFPSSAAPVRTPQPSRPRPTPAQLAWQREDADRINRNIIWEIALAAYALWGILLASQVAPTFMPYLTIYMCAFGAVGFWGLRDYLALRRAA